jgi:hypothetical protein
MNVFITQPLNDSTWKTQFSILTLLLEWHNRICQRERKVKNSHANFEIECMRTNKRKKGKD